MSENNISGYRWRDAELNSSHSYLLPALKAELANVRKDNFGVQTLFDLGCGNGSVANALNEEGWTVTGVDASDEGIQRANYQYPHLKLYKGSAYDDLVATYGQFPVVICLEVVEHLYAPRDCARNLFNLVESGGVLIMSTPYHGYLKNLALAITGRFDRHFTAMWDNGHIKFWSIRTLTDLLFEAGFREIRFVRVGRLPQLAKSMIAIAKKPS